MNIQAEDVINALFNPNEKVCLRVFADRKGDPFSGQKYSCEAAKYNDYTDVLNKHNAVNRGIFYVVNLGGDNDKDITRINAQFVEMDEGSFEEQQAKIDTFALPPSMIIRTRKSLHTYWFMKDAKVERFRAIQKGLVQHFHGDPACVNESRVMRLPGFNHCKQEPVEVVCIGFHPERKYTQEQLEALLPIEEEAVIEVKKGTEKGLNIVQHECDFIKHCKEHATELSEYDWYAMISNLAVFEGGDKLIHELSIPYPGYNESVTNKKINHFIESGTKPMTCAVIAEKGFKCPRFGDGSCSCKAPTALCYQPMGVTGLRDILSGLTAAGDVVVDMQTAIQFVEEYLYNVDPATAGTIINYELKKVFKDFKAAELKALISRQKQLAKDYQSGQKARQNKLEVSDFQEWYVSTEKGFKFMPGVLAEHMAESQNVFYAAETYYVYRNGVYVEMPELEAQKLIRDKMISTETKMNQITDAEHQWRILVQKDLRELNANPFIINLKNGLYNVQEDAIVEHTPDYYSTVQLNASYNPKAQCPRFRQYLTEVLDADQIPLIQEMLGYFLVPITRAQKCFVIVGEGGAGKSQLLLVLNQVLLGSENVSNVSWQALNERFKTAELFGKLANIFADLPTKNIDDNGIFKALVGEDYLTVEKKNRNPFSFQSKARLLFSCNNIPRNLGDKSEGFYRRLILIRFDHAVPEDIKDPNLLEKLRGEADGIFLFALEGLRRLIANNYKFSVTERNIRELNQYREESDNVLSFVGECCELGDTYDYGSTELYNAYKGFCDDSGVKPYSQKNFVKQLMANFPGVDRSVDKLGKRRIITGLRFIPDDFA